MSPADAGKPTKITHQILLMSMTLDGAKPPRCAHITFGLKEDTDNDGAIQWEIDFTLQERAKASADFTDIVNLKVKVKAKNHPAAQATAIEGLSDAQITHLSRHRAGP